MNYIIQILKNNDLRKKILFVLLLLLVYRIISHIPIPAEDPVALKQFLESLSQNGGSFVSFIDVFSGGAIGRFSVAMMGVGPYITASIIIQLLTVVVPKLEQLSKEGEQGRNKINQYSRLLTLPLAFVEGYGMIRFLESISAKEGTNFFGNPSLLFWFLMLLTIAATTIFLMWIGENITEKGIGNGISMIIFAGILAGVPGSAFQNISKIFVGAFNPQEFVKFMAILAVGAIVILSIVFVTEAERRLTVSYAKRIRGAKLYGGIDTYLPIKLNASGVIPIIFAGAFMSLPQVIGFFSSAKNEIIRNSASWIQATFAPDKWPYFVLFFVLIFAFTFFSTFLYFKPKDVSENIQKQGGFIPGIRPGKETEEYLKYLLYRVTLWGAVFLGLISILPFLIQYFGKTSSIAIGGISLLIVVSVAMEIQKKVRAQLIVRKYENLA